MSTAESDETEQLDYLPSFSDKPLFLHSDDLKKNYSRKKLFYNCARIIFFFSYRNSGSDTNKIITII